MKRISILFFLVIILSSCGREPVFITEENPFIIGKIEKVYILETSMWVYTRDGFNNWVYDKPSTITVDKLLPYQVGDTLKLKYY